ncbi:MAG: nucleotidyltransferase family protein [Ardenticatenaceae bacterium]|nr:nucleotidyltransferase family protein [Ardenticatenaceae bacterium]
MGQISAIVVAAGLSTRMGTPKQLLPFGPHTVIEQVVSVLLRCALDEVVVITGHKRHAIEATLAAWAVRPVFNPNYQTGEVLCSVQCGLSALGPSVSAALIVLGDQPHLEAGVVRRVLDAYQDVPGRLVIPSYQMRRGHPILIDRARWPEIVSLGADKTLRHAINAHAGDIRYVVVETDSVLRDMDTPEEYRRELRRWTTQADPSA